MLLASFRRFLIFSWMAFLLSAHFLASLFSLFRSSLSGANSWFSFSISCSGESDIFFHFLRWASALIFWINFASFGEMEKDCAVVVVKGFVPV